MKGKIAVLVGTALLVGALPAGAGAPPIDGTGSVGTCATVTQIKIKPALVTGGTSPITLSIKTKPPKGAPAPCPGATGDGLNVLSGKAKGSGTDTTNDCANLVGVRTPT